jgi:hypothetical protein
MALTGEKDNGMDEQTNGMNEKKRISKAKAH